VLMDSGTGPRHEVQEIAEELHIDEFSLGVERREDPHEEDDHVDELRHEVQEIAEELHIDELNLREEPREDSHEVDDHVDELRREVSDDEVEGIAHPASLQLHGNPLFHTAEWTHDSNQESSGAACSICLLEFDPGQHVTTISRCRHSFHLPCIRRWMEAPPFSCPMCRIDASEVHVSSSLLAGARALRHGQQPMPKLAGPSFKQRMSASNQRPSRVAAKSEIRNNCAGRLTPSLGIGSSSNASIFLVGPAPRSLPTSSAGGLNAPSRRPALQGGKR